MRKYEILPHTADVRLKVSSDTHEGLFAAALEGMNRIISGSAGRKNMMAAETAVVEVSSKDESMLLIDFLSEVLTLSHTNKCVYSLNRIDEISRTGIKAALGKIDITEFDEDIKAVTYTEAKIEKNSEGILETIIVFDI